MPIRHPWKIVQWRLKGDWARERQTDLEDMGVDAEGMGEVQAATFPVGSAQALVSCKEISAHRDASSAYFAQIIQLCNLEYAKLGCRFKKKKKKSFICPQKIAPQTFFYFWTFS